MNIFIKFIFYILLFLSKLTSSANILGIFPFTAKSHYIMFEPLLLALQNRGHNITVLSHFPQKMKLENFTDISLVGATRSLDSNLSLDTIENTPFNLYQNLNKLYDEIDDYEPIFSIPKIQQLLNSNTSFELIITEIFNTDMFLGFVYKFKSPFISMSASPLMPWAYERFSNPDNPAYVPVIFTSFHDKMNFISRLQNFLNLIFSKLAYSYLFDIKSQKIAMKYFPNLPPLNEIARNTSLILVNSHFSLHKPAPLSPKVIHVGGLHIREPKKLDKELDNFINEAEKGVILLSMGSMFRSESLPMNIRLAFEKAFLRLPQRVIWKWENENYLNNSGKILYKKWLPQRDVLAHKNVKLFIYHGGLLGTMEAVYCGVPILGIPMYGDMPVNLAAVTSAGSGTVLTFQQITEDSVYSTINNMINNPSFKERAIELSKTFKDRVIPPLEEAVYWAEYVIRHKGAHHLTSSANHLYWYQYYLIDVILLLIILLFLFLMLYIYFLRLILRVLNKYLCLKIKIKTT